jgi:hypothetical protein
MRESEYKGLAFPIPKNGLPTFFPVRFKSGGMRSFRAPNYQRDVQLSILFLSFHLSAF